MFPTLRPGDERYELGKKRLPLQLKNLLVRNHEKKLAPMLRPESIPLIRIHQQHETGGREAGLPREHDGKESQEVKGHKAGSSVYCKSRARLLK